MKCGKKVLFVVLELGYFQSHMDFEARESVLLYLIFFVNRRGYDTVYILKR